MEQIPSVEQSVGRIVDTLHRIAQGELPARTRIGIVLASPPNIVVQVDDIPLTKENVYISSYLLSGYTRHVVGETSNRGGGSGDASYESHNHPIDNDETWTDTLVPGDLVLVVPLEGDQLYVIADKVVKL
ncbi:MAG: DUF2577 domain-containing protein [Selenomonadaceae bacterium]|nr:DUF2577 domain-containing protein [Selenomonadaceae bacterium]